MCRMGSIAQYLLLGIQDSDQTHVVALRTVSGAGKRRAEAEGSETRDDAQHSVACSAHLFDDLCRGAGFQLEQNCGT